MMLKPGSCTKVAVVSSLIIRSLILITPGLYLINCLFMIVGRDSCFGIATDYGLDGPGIESRWGARFSARPDRSWGPPSLLYNGYRVFPGSKGRPGHAVDHSPPSSAEVLEE